MDLQDRNYYELFGLERDASRADIDRAYRQMRALYAPGGQYPDPEIIEYVEHAYQVLVDPQRRKLFDSLLAETYSGFSLAIQQNTEDIPVSDEPQMIYLLGELQVLGEGLQAGNKPLNLTLVVDQSTSMQGDRLQCVKQALQEIVSQLAPDDHLSLISFNDRATVVLPSCPAGQHDTPRRRIEEIEASGGTEIYQGLLAGIFQLRSVPLEEYDNQLVLLTDGRTYGDEAACLRLAADAAASGITIQAFGIGADWDDEFIDALAAPSGGTVAYIDEADQIVATLQSLLTSMGQIDAEQVKLQTSWPQSVELLDSLRLTPYAQSLKKDDGALLLGEMRGAQPLTFLLTFMAGPQPIPTRIRIPVDITIELPNASSQSISESVMFNVLGEVSAPPPPAQVVRAARLATLYHMHQHAWQDAEAGLLDA
ncbi:MAG: vWA domain-containing protein, partial [Candidatus Promineifilaceae bacterium]